MTDNPTPTFAHFNPTQNPVVDQIKSKTDELIALVRQNAKDPRRSALAATNYEQAAMWAVKAMF